MLFLTATYAVLLGLVAADCPPYWSFLAQDNLCYSVVSTAGSYGQAVRTCEASDGDVVKISDAFTNQAILQATKSHTPLYIGVERQSNGQWTYSDGSALTYSNWDAGEPRNSSNNCAVIVPPNAKWASADCNAYNGFVCSKSSDPNPCPKQWFYSTVTGFCYYLKDYTMSDGKTWDMADPTEAEVRCRMMHTKAHLASVHDAIEQQVLFDLIKTSNMLNATNAPSFTNGCTASYAWTGLIWKQSAGNFSWTDGTPYDFAPSIYKFSQDTYYAMINDASCNGKWWGSFGIVTNSGARYICKIDPKNL
ncbi:unnamed protein product, partial [Mesorhabditis spiculigera]